MAHLGGVIIAVTVDFVQEKSLVFPEGRGMSYAVPYTQKQTA